MPTHVKSISRHKISGGSQKPVDWLQCNDSGEVALTKSVPILKVMDEENNLIYTNEDFEKVIVGYRVCDKEKHHTHLGKKVWNYYFGYWTYSLGKGTCITCGYPEL